MNNAVIPAAGEDGVGLLTRIRDIVAFGSGCQAMRAMGHIPIYRGEREKAIASINRGAKMLQKSGQQLVFFPEGTRSRDGQIHAFKKGAFVFAIESQLPLIPFAINGSYQCCPPGQKKVHAGIIQVKMLPTLDTSRYEAAQRDELIVEVRDQIVDALAIQQQAIPVEKTFVFSHIE